jgi:pimeloyl-ACP methyl ester carboxylesterase
MSDLLRVPIDVGTGPAVALLPGFGLTPVLYATAASGIAGIGRARVIVPELYRVRARWQLTGLVERLDATIDHLGIDRLTIIGHSFSGGIELAYALRRPERIVELVFVDTLAVSRELPLARETLRHPSRLLRMATPSVATAFLGTALRHPRRLAGAAWFGFTSGRDDGAEEVARLGLRAHVLWANRDSLLRRTDGCQFAREMNASFSVVNSSSPVDHDWPFRYPDLFVNELRALDLSLWSTASPNSAGGRVT